MSMIVIHDWEMEELERKLSVVNPSSCCLMFGALMASINFGYVIGTMNTTANYMHLSFQTCSKTELYITKTISVEQSRISAELVAEAKKDQTAKAGEVDSKKETLGKSRPRNGSWSVHNNIWDNYFCENRPSSMFPSSISHPGRWGNDVTSDDDGAVNSSSSDGTNHGTNPPTILNSLFGHPRPPKPTIATHIVQNRPGTSKSGIPTNKSRSGSETPPAEKKGTAARPETAKVSGGLQTKHSLKNPPGNDPHNSSGHTHHPLLSYNKNTNSPTTIDLDRVDKKTGRIILSRVQFPVTALNESDQENYLNHHGEWQVNNDVAPASFLQNTKNMNKSVDLLPNDSIIDSNKFVSASIENYAGTFLQKRSQKPRPNKLPPDEPIPAGLREIDLVTTYDSWWRHDMSCKGQTWGGYNLMPTIAALSMLVGAAIGSFMAGMIADMVGRRWTMLISALTSSGAFILAACSKVWYVFFLARFSCGITVSIGGVCVPIFITEILSVANRGKYGITHQLFLTFGIFAVSILGYVWSPYTVKDFYESDLEDFNLTENFGVIKESEVESIFGSKFDYGWRGAISVFPLLCNIVTLIIFLGVYHRFETPAYLIGTLQPTQNLPAVKEICLARRMGDPIRDAKAANRAVHQHRADEKARVDMRAMTAILSLTPAQRLASDQLSTISGHAAGNSATNSPRNSRSNPRASAAQATCTDLEELTMNVIGEVERAKTPLNVEQLATARGLGIGVVEAIPSGAFPAQDSPRSSGGTTAALPAGYDRKHQLATAINTGVDPIDVDRWAPIMDESIPILSQHSDLSELESARRSAGQHALGENLLGMRNSAGGEYFYDLDNVDGNLNRQNRASAAEAEAVEQQTRISGVQSQARPSAAEVAGMDHSAYGGIPQGYMESGLDSMSHHGSPMRGPMGHPLHQGSHQARTHGAMMSSLGVIPPRGDLPSSGTFTGASPIAVNRNRQRYFQLLETLRTGGNPRADDILEVIYGGDLLDRIRTSLDTCWMSEFTEEEVDSEIISMLYDRYEAETEKQQSVEIGMCLRSVQGFKKQAGPLGPRNSFLKAPQDAARASAQMMSHMGMSSLTNTQSSTGGSRRASAGMRVPGGEESYGDGLYTNGNGDVIDANGESNIVLAITDGSNNIDNIDGSNNIANNSCCLFPQYATESQYISYYNILAEARAPKENLRLRESAAQQVSTETAGEFSVRESAGEAQPLIIRDNSELRHSVNSWSPQSNNPQKRGRRKREEGLCCERYRRGIIIGVCLAIAQQFTGINAAMTSLGGLVANYGKEWTPIITSGLMFLNFVTTFPSICLIDSMGRRTLLLLSGAGTLGPMAINLILTISKEYVGESSKASLDYMSLAFLGIYIIAFAIGWGPVMSVYFADIFPGSIRSSAISLCLGANWAIQLPVVFILSIMTTQPIIQYSLFTALNLVAFLFVLFFIIETRGSDPENSPMYMTKNEAEAYYHAQEHALEKGSSALQASQSALKTIRSAQCNHVFLPAISEAEGDDGSSYHKGSPKQGGFSGRSIPNIPVAIPGTNNVGGKSRKHNSQRGIGSELMVNNPTPDMIEAIMNEDHRNHHRRSDGHDGGPYPRSDMSIYELPRSSEGSYGGYGG